jgi:hypothetical protein
VRAASDRTGKVSPQSPDISPRNGPLWLAEVGCADEIAPFDADALATRAGELIAKVSSYQPKPLTAFVALAIEKYEAEQAKKRLATSTGGAKPQPKALVPEAGKGQARDKAAQLVGINSHYVSDAKALEKRADAGEEWAAELITEIKAGGKTITQAIFPRTI